MDKDIERLTDIAEELGWKCTEGSDKYYDGTVSLWMKFKQEIPAGKDFIFTARGETAYEIAKDVFRYAETFYLLEHVRLDLLAKGGPDYYTLAMDAIEIKETMLYELADKLLWGSANWT